MSLEQNDLGTRRVHVQCHPELQTRDSAEVQPPADVGCHSYDQEHVPSFDKEPVIQL